MSVLRWSGFVVGVGILIGCGKSPGDVAPEFQVSSVNSVVERLEDAGLAVEVAGPIVQSFYPADATQLLVDGEEMMMFEFDSEAGAEANSNARPLVQWASTPHFYLSGRFMALYVGTTGRVLEALEEVFGEELDP